MDNHLYRLPEHTIECIAGVGAAASVCAGAGDAFGRLAAFRAEHRGEWMFGHFGYGLAEETEPGSGGIMKGCSRRSEDAGTSAEGSFEGRGGNVSVRTEDAGTSAEGSFECSGGAVSVGTEDAGGRAARCGETAGTNNAGEGNTRWGETAADRIGFPDLYFFVPEVVLELSATEVRIGSLGDDPGAIWEAICREDWERRKDRAEGQSGHKRPIGELAAWEARFTRQEYLDTVEALRQHILRGDCYEINFCQEFYSYPARIDPVATWAALSEASPNPFGAFYRVGESWLLCASPERYLRRQGDHLISQPIKGTSPRFPSDRAADEASRQNLFLSAKDRSENVMVVDLVRNDLSRICLADSVRVTELYGIYSFPQVHQMISTIEGVLPTGIDITEAVRASFPMGSMTGAPKRRVVELIRQYERSRRGLFSGSVGYVRPDGDFDLNVVIRSLLYNAADEYLAYQVGSGITFYSDPAQEYEECLVKAKGIKKALE